MDQTDFETYYLDKAEYAKIMSQINTNYFDLYEGKRFCAHYSLGTDDRYYIYYFENYGYNNYNIVEKIEF